MAALKLPAVAALIAAVTPAHADPIERWHPLIAQASSLCGMPALWIERVMYAESRGYTMLAGRPITSRAGAMGLMQLMPATWSEMRVRLGLGADPHDPHDNILAGSCFLRRMYDRFGYPGLFGAYSAGPARYAAYITAAQPLPAETRAYLASLSGTLAPSVPVRAVQPEQGLFVPVATAASRDLRLFISLNGDGATP